jgi:small subunit ribosomal protein S4
MKTVAKYKMCRRLGAGVFEKCQTQKFTAVEQKTVRAGANVKRPKAPSGFGLQLLEKQRVRFTYGISERQLQNYVKVATQVKGMPVTDKLYELLESRLDSVIYRLGFAATRRFARQMSSHGHFVVNGKKSTIPSQQIHIGDIVSVREGSKSSPMFAEFAKNMKDKTYPTWLKLSVEQMSSEVVAKPKNDEQFLKFETVLEFYSR